MPRINLLPWREEQRRERKLAFLVALGGGTLAAVVTAFAAYLLMGSMVDAQQRRNAMLSGEVKQPDKRLKFQGVAQSSTRVSAFMRNIDGSEWLKDPELEVVESGKEKTVGSSFTLFADEVSTDAPANAKAPPARKVMASRGSPQ